MQQDQELQKKLMKQFMMATEEMTEYLVFHRIAARDAQGQGVAQTSFD